MEQKKLNLRYTLGKDDEFGHELGKKPFVVFNTNASEYFWPLEELLSKVHQDLQDTLYGIEWTDWEYLATQVVVYEKELAVRMIDRCYDDNDLKFKDAWRVNRYFDSTILQSHTDLSMR